MENFIEYLQPIKTCSIGQCPTIKRDTLIKFTAKVNARTDEVQKETHKIGV